MEKKKLRMVAERIITIILVGTLIFSSKLSGVDATAYMPDQEPVETMSDEQSEATEASEEEELSADPSDEKDISSEKDSPDEEPEISISDNDGGGTVWPDINEPGVLDGDEPLRSSDPLGLQQDDPITGTAETDTDETYIVTTDEGERKGAFNSLEEAVAACPINVACTITVTQDDEIDAEVAINSKEITLTSSEAGPWTITQTAAGRHFRMEGSNLTLSNIILSGTGITSGTADNGGVYLWYQSMLTMKDNAVIENCFANNGGGVEVAYGQTGFLMESGTIQDNIANYGGGVYISDSNKAFSFFTMTGGSISGNVAVEGGGIYTEEGSYSNPAGTGYYTNIRIAGDAEVKDNSASIRYSLPDDYDQFTDFPGKLLNNDEINYTGSASVYTVTYHANNGTAESHTQKTDAGTGKVSVKLLNDSDVNFTEPGDEYILAGWSTQEGENGKEYDLGEVITITDSLILHAVWEEPDIYIVTKEDGTRIGRYPTLAGAVDACLTNEACVITATQDDEIDAAVDIPHDKDITLTSLAETEARTIRQVAEVGSSFSKARHFYVYGSLTLDNIVLTGTGNTSSSIYNGGVYVDGSDASDARLKMVSKAVIEQCSNYSGGGVYAAGGTFIMEGGEIRECRAMDAISGYGGGVYVNNGKFTMQSGEISNNTARNYGGGVYGTAGSELRMEDGIISGNVCSYDNGQGGGVSVWAGKFTMAGGTLSGNKAGSGGAVYVNERAEFELDGGIINENEAFKYYGGGVYVQKATFEFLKGEVSGNKAAEYGGGVYFNGADTGVLKMSDGLISGNNATEYGGGVYVRTGKFTMVSGTISDNNALDYYGGGVYVYSGEFGMDSGTISGNTAVGYGGGVSVRAGEFTMTGGEIIKNRATRYGGGVAVQNDAALVMTAGLITGNTGTDGGGIYTTDHSYDNPASLDAYTNITISNKDQVTGNTARAKYVIPENYAEFNDFPGELLNNNEINYKGAYLVTYDANNNDEEERYTQKASPGTGNVLVTLLEEKPENFTAPDGYVLAGWNTQADGEGKEYGLGEKITINDSLTLYAVWEQDVYVITEEYYSTDGTQIQEATTETVTAGADYEKTAPVLAGYRYLGYRLDSGELQTGTTVSIGMVDQAHTVTFVYEEYSEIIHVSVPVKLLWAAYDSDGGEVISPEYYFFNHSTYDISVTLQKLTIIEADGLDLVEDITAGSGGSDKVALQLEPVTERAGWSATNRVSLIAGDNEDGLLGQIKAGGQGFSISLGPMAATSSVLIWKLGITCSRNTKQHLRLN